MKKIILFPALFAVLVLILFLLYRGIIPFNQPDSNLYPVRGIDVSHHQGEILWSRLRGKIDFVYIKATEGGDFVDPQFSVHWEEARRAGIATGAYHFFTLCRSGREQAENFNRTVPVEKNSLPPVVDLEFLGNCRKPPENFMFARELADYLRLVSAKYRREPVLYSTAEFMDKYPLMEFGKDLWIREIFFSPPQKMKWKIWQYSSRLRMEGIHGYVDGNVFHGDRLEFERWRRAKAPQFSGK